MKHELWTADYALDIKYGLSITNWAQNTDCGLNAAYQLRSVFLNCWSKLLYLKYNTNALVCTCFATNSLVFTPAGVCAISTAQAQNALPINFAL